MYAFVYTSCIVLYCSNRLITRQSCNTNNSVKE